MNVSPFPKYFHECFIDMQGNICNECKKPIIGNTTESNGLKYHPSCFKCFDCKKVLGGTFVNLAGKSKCKDCAAPKADQCCKCHKEVSVVKHIEFAGKMFL
jgi:hypothetical protein